MYIWSFTVVLSSFAFLTWAKDGWIFIFFKLYSTSPPRQVKEKFTRGIVSLFPYLSDPFSKNGCVSVTLFLSFISVLTCLKCWSHTHNTRAEWIEMNFAIDLTLLFFSSPSVFLSNMTMMVRVALDSWHGESKLLREAWLKIDEHHSKVQNEIQKSPALFFIYLFF